MSFKLPFWRTTKEWYNYSSNHLLEDSWCRKFFASHLYLSFPPSWGEKEAEPDALRGMLWTRLLKAAAAFCLLWFQECNYKQKSCHLPGSRSPITGTKMHVIAHLNTVSLAPKRRCHTISPRAHIPAARLAGEESPPRAKQKLRSSSSVAATWAIQPPDYWPQCPSLTSFTFSDSSCVRSSKLCSCMNLFQSRPQALKLRFWYKIALLNILASVS